ncbi:MAG: hypothetical protein FVQ81_01105 [Candidatus Glassbacteria bacterium]|nr:hypothetical protein [Candidatus Glassbacteria bacterium]
MFNGVVRGPGLFAILLALAVAVPASVRAETILREDFEDLSLEGKWEKLSGDTTEANFETRPEHVRSGKASYRITALEPEREAYQIHGYQYREADSWIRTWFLPGYDQVYVRWYAKFADDFRQGRQMHWSGLRGCRTDNPNSGFGRAGERPTGTDRFTTSVEPAFTEGHEPPGQMCFYSYWPEMKQSGDGKYWGNRFRADPPFFLERGRWYCFEMMVKLNEPGQRDGEQALWVDGRKIIHEKNFRWRDSEILKLNLWKFGLYIHYSEQDCTYWVDDLVISTDYVGPED